MTDQSASPPASKEKKSLISYKAWIVILVLILLVAISHPVPGEGLDYMAGRFIGSLLVIAGVWALAVIVYRWMSGHFRKAT
jgi:protein-S-isoprenylcysteine O-methyltransferase Ste14